MLIYGIVALISALFFLAFTREAPPTPPCPPGQESRALMLDGLKSMLKMRDIWVLLGLFLVGMGVFNGVSTWIEGIVSPKGFSITQAGDMGGFLLIGGILGAAFIPALSDKFRKRKIFLLVGLLLVVPCLIGVTYATSYWFLAVAMFALGFCLMSLAPIGYQYAAEITFPAPEGTSNGLMNLAGQISVVFVYAMEALKSPDGSFTVSLIFLAILTIASGLSVAFIKESNFEAHLASNVEI
jgi:Na+/melibiose symporter-like transporter